MLYNRSTMPCTSCATPFGGSIFFCLTYPGFRSCLAPPWATICRHFVAIHNTTAGLRFSATSWLFLSRRWGWATICRHFVAMPVTTAGLCSAATSWLCLSRRRGYDMPPLRGYSQHNGGATFFRHFVAIPITTVGLRFAATSWLFTTQRRGYVLPPLRSAIRHPRESGDPETRQRKPMDPTGLPLSRE